MSKGYEERRTECDMVQKDRWLLSVISKINTHGTDWSLIID